jgi:hypothetical protein
MGVMASSATLFDRGMQIFQLKILFEIIVAFKTEGAAIKRRNQKGGVGRGMGTMAGDTIALLNRRMLGILHEHLCVMAIQAKSAERITVIFQLITISGLMGVVAIRATLLDRRMDDFLLKFVLAVLMAIGAKRPTLFGDKAGIKSSMGAVTGNANAGPDRTVNMPGLALVLMTYGGAVDPRGLQLGEIKNAFFETVALLTAR